MLLFSGVNCWNGSLGGPLPACFGDKRTFDICSLTADSLRFLNTARQRVTLYSLMHFRKSLGNISLVIRVDAFITGYNGASRPVKYDHQTTISCFLANILSVLSQIPHLRLCMYRITDQCSQICSLTLLQVLRGLWSHFFVLVGPYQTCLTYCLHSKTSSNPYFLKDRYSHPCPPWT